VSSVLVTSRLILRPYTADDVPLVLPIFGDPLTMAFWPQPLTEAAVAAWVQRNSAAFQAVRLGRLLVELRDTHVAIGDCGIVGSEVNGRPEYDLGYIIHHPYWRQGFGSECAQACRDYGIHTLGLRRIVANMACDHIASMRVAERLGMQREATFHNPRNRNILTYLYALHR
jgi:RimJ/RimL family protein N-acetyltransferase